MWLPSFLLLLTLPAGVPRRQSPLSVSDLPPLPMFSGWTNSTITLSDSHSPTPAYNTGQSTRLDVAAGTVVYPRPIDAKHATPIYVLPGVLPRASVASVLAMLTRRDGPAWDTDPDSIDGMTSDEMHLMSDEPSYKEGMAGGNKLKGDIDPVQLAARAPVRRAVSAILDPIVNTSILPFVRRSFPKLCGSTSTSSS